MKLSALKTKLSALKTKLSALKTKLSAFKIVSLQNIFVLLVLQLFVDLFGLVIDIIQFFI